LAAPIPENENERLEQLHSYGVLDTEAEQAFDDLTFLASQICQTPMALITLIDGERQWIKSNVGTDLTETSREQAFCSHAILHQEVMEVPDATRDERFADNDFVSSDDGIRFYAGAPLVTPDGYALGTLCALDRTPGELTEEQRRSLAALSRQVVSQLELRRAAAEREQARHAVMQAKESAEAANRAKSDFLANTSHEIRTPLTAIMGYADVLRDRSQSAEQHNEAARIIRSSSEHLLGIIDDILDLSKMEAGEMVVERVATSPWQLTSEVASTARMRASQKDLKFELHQDPPLPETIQTDPTRLRQILMNLTNNAVKFTDNGVVRLITSLSEPDEHTGRPKLQFEVIDSGMGMTRVQIQGLFEPFRQGDQTTTRRHGGTGLGLNISKRLAQMLGGDIRVDSQLGRGTVFTLTVDPGPLENMRMLEQTPHEAEDQAMSAASGTDRLPRLRGRVLLAEDGQHNRNLLRLFLEQGGMTVTEAQNGRVACDRYFQAREAGAPFDVVLMDMQMPEVDGYEATQRLRERGCEAPIIALTAHAMVGDRDRCLQVGCTDYLSKPIKQPDLLEALAGYLQAEPATGGGATPTAEEPVVSSPNVSEDDVPHAGAQSGPQAGDDAVASLTQAFIDDLPRQVAELEQLQSEQQREAVADRVHTLKGTAGTYGFEGIAASAASLQAAFEAGEAFDAMQQQINDLLQMVRTVEGYDHQQERARHAPNGSDTTPAADQPGPPPQP
jgi:signal transduction histidine kinase/DNA-binding response OmpR family regulator